MKCSECTHRDVCVIRSDMRHAAKRHMFTICRPTVEVKRDMYVPTMPDFVDSVDNWLAPHCKHYKKTEMFEEAKDVQKCCFAGIPEYGACSGKIKLRSAYPGEYAHFCDGHSEQEQKMYHNISRIQNL